MNFSIPAPAGFDFRRTLQSHGWYDLPPFELVGDATLLRVLDAGEAAPVTVTIKSEGRALQVSTPRRLGKRAAARVEREPRIAVRHVRPLLERRSDDRIHRAILRRACRRALQMLCEPAVDCVGQAAQVAGKAPAGKADVATVARAFSRSSSSSPANSRRSVPRSSYTASPMVSPDCPIRTPYQGPLWNRSHSIWIAAS